MKEVFEVYLDDFVPERQEQLLDFLGVESPSELNLDVLPIHTFEKEELLSDVAEAE